MKKIDNYVAYHSGFKDIWCYEAPLINPMDPTRFDYITSSVVKGKIEDVIEHARAHKRMMEYEYGVTFDIEFIWPSAYNTVYSLEDPLAEAAIIMKGLFV